jgi:hypothetical protein
MRGFLYIALIAAIWDGGAVHAQQADDQGALPPGGMDITAPGFSFHSPGSPWRYGGYEASLNEFRRGGEAAEFEIRTGRASVELEVRPYTWIGKWSRDRPPAENLMAEISLLASLEGSHERPLLRRTAQPHVRSVTVNGAACVRWNATLEPVDTTRPSQPRAIQHGLLCSHPEFPGFAVQMTYTEHDMAGGQLAMFEESRDAFFRSLKFTSLGYRVHEVPLAGRPWMLARTDNALWVVDTTASNDCDNGMVLVRVDPQTNLEVAQLPIGHACNIMADHEGVWVLNATDQLVLVDPHTTRVARTLRIPKGVTHFASGGDFLWVTTYNPGNPGRLIRIDPISGAAQTVDGIGNDPEALAATARNVFVSDFWQDGIQVVDIATRQIIRKLNVPNGVFALRAFDEFLWTVQLEEAPSSVLRVDPAILEAAPAQFGDLAPSRPIALAWWNGRLCVLGSHALGLIDPVRRSVELLPLPGGVSNDLIEAGGSLWIAGPQTLLRIDPK